jgi:uncharacterized repeat protein (TIGR03809 family)
VRPSFSFTGILMTHRTDLARGRDIVARWCDLAERRLEHLTELFDSGRWRRYHSEAAFLENIREARAAVETWRDLLSREASLDNSAIDMSWLGREPSMLPPDDRWRERLPRLQPPPTPAEPPPRDTSVAMEDVLVALETELIAPYEVPAAAEVPALGGTPLPALDLTVMQERYPSLRNAL